MPRDTSFSDSYTCDGCYFSTLACHAKTSLVPKLMLSDYHTNCVGCNASVIYIAQNWTLENSATLSNWKKNFYTFSVSNSFKSIYRSYHIFNCRQLFPKQLSAVENVITTINLLEIFRNKESKGSSIWVNIAYIYMEQYIPFSLIKCEPFSRILEIL